MAAIVAGSVAAIRRQSTSIPGGSRGPHMAVYSASAICSLKLTWFEHSDTNVFNNVSVADVVDGGVAGCGAVVGATVVVVAFSRALVDVVSLALPQAAR